MSYQVTPVLVGSAIRAGQTVNISIGYSAVVIYNISYVGLTVSDPKGNTLFIAPNTADRMLLDTTDDYITLYPQYSITSNVPPVDKVIMVAYLSTEVSSDNRLFPFNLGNVTPSITSLTNDGNVPGTQFIESTNSANTSGIANFTADNNGNHAIREGTTPTTLLQTIANGASGAANVLLGKAGNFITQVQGKLAVIGSSSLDNGAITTDGNGALTVVNIAPTKINGITTQGYGAPLIVNVQTNLAVTSNALTNIASYTVPSGNVRVVRVAANLICSSTNTNGPIVSFYVSTTSNLNTGVTNQFFDITNGNGTPIVANAAALVRGPFYTTIPFTFGVTVGATVNVFYQNNVAGTINDLLNCVIELLA